MNSFTNVYMNMVLNYEANIDMEMDIFVSE
jgi:hypothetical protein